MGFSSEAILIKPSIEEGRFTSFLQQLGVVQPQFNRKAYFEEADTRDKNGIYIGNYKGSTFLLFESMFAQKRGEDLMTSLERTLTELLPEHELLSLSNEESSNTYLYHYIKSGESVRLKAGNCPEVLYDVGNELYLEKARYTKKEKDAEGDYIYYTSSELAPGELITWSHDQIGGSVAYGLAEMFIGHSYEHVPLDLSLHQYFSKEDLVSFQKIPSPKLGEGIRYFNRKLIKADILPIIEEQIVPIFQAKGFQYKPEKCELVREINSIQQSLQFTLQSNSELIFDLHLSFEVNASKLLKEWSINKYNKHTFGNGNEIDNRQPILKYEHQLPDVHYTDDASIISIETFGDLLTNYTQKYISPYFELFAGYRAFAEYSYYKCFRADFYYMMGESEKALRVLAELYESIYQQETKGKYLDDIAVRLSYELPDTPIEELLKMVIKDDRTSALDWESPNPPEEMPPENKKNKHWWNKLIE